MKLKGLVWFFAIALILISIWELSYTWVVRNYEGEVQQKAVKQVKAAYPNATADEQEQLVASRVQHILDSTRDKKIYPVIGTSYQKCKENELNLGLDLQGGMSVTMNVSLEGLIKSLSINPNDPKLIKAIQTATAQKVNSDVDFVTLFTDAYTQQNPGVNLASIFAKSGNDIKASDDNKKVIDQLHTIANGAINQTYKVLQKRIDKFGVAQPTINLDASKGVINVELAGIKDPKRVRAFLQSSANLQFWELYNIDEVGQDLSNADKALGATLNSIPDSLLKKTDSTKSQAQLQQEHPILTHIRPIQATDQDKNGVREYAAPFAEVALKDTGVVTEYLNNPVFINNLTLPVKFLFGPEEKDKQGNSTGVVTLYAIKKRPGTDKPRIEGDAITNALQQTDPTTNEVFVTMDMNNQGKLEWGKMTTEACQFNPHKPIAIVLDDIVYSAPFVNEPIMDGTSRITISKGKGMQDAIQEAQDLSDVLKSGKLDAPAKIVAEQIVGPTLGKEAVHGGAMSFIVSFIVIFALMLIYYNTGGWVANISLILNLLFTIGVLAALGFTLTSAGIAGLVLTIGMAVDTNVIIFERIKEELTKGKNYQQAVNDGYRRSLAPVIDAHVTTFLTAAILFTFGLGPVLGFATTQMLGIVLSLFCGILVSRLITDFWTNKQRHFNYFTGVSKKIFKHASFKFIEYRKVAYGISVVVLLLGIGSYFNGFHEGVEFKGGRSYTIEFAQPVKNDAVRDDLKDALGGDYPVIKTVKDNRHLNITTSYLIGQENADSAVQAGLYKGLSKALNGVSYPQFVKSIQSTQTVQPTISSDLKKGAIKATVFAILIIFVYIFLRFRDWRYSAGTIVALLHDVLVTLAVFSFCKNIVPFPLEIDQHFIAAVLTVIGFSMNDTVIVFDRIREYSKGSKASDKPSIINRAINDTLSRTIMTSLTVFLTILILFIFGGEVTRGFAFAMLIGVITGTYSSIFVAAPMLVDLAKDRPLGEAEPEKTAVKTVNA
ncbi:protein translocase subunit SecDF [Ferruginibacter albus]|uniref:protein translocase subunit SecDF n=1 Tax=Ferruginibacter albus TaxID=2875540 RepID=UPI001CC338F0|nr:protein translocase subunit SecDF [Ferruginibacter albus]UAY53576.1 protein translocase subunit SecDF [Ferruginibacter albus]